MNTFRILMVQLGTRLDALDVSVGKQSHNRVTKGV